MLKTALKPFQQKTIEWMLNQEDTNGGGLLLSDAGTGKTICCLALASQKMSTHGKTLVLCPAGVVSNWANEILKHTHYTSKNIFKYVGKERKMQLQNDSDQHMFYIASYSLVARESSDSGEFAFETGSLFNNQFSRIILDEAHYIRNWNRKVFKCVMKIRSECKWVVTATPIFNKVDDIYSYFRFLELEGIDSRKEWHQLTHSASGIQNYRNLNDIVKKHSIRLLKRNVLNEELPPKQEIDIKVTLSDFEREFYESLWNYSVKRMQALSTRVKLLAGLTDLNSQMLRKIFTNNILVYILRLKQSCNNPWLVINKMKRLENVKTLQRARECLDFYNSSLNMEEECPICYDNVANAIASPCGHKCCIGCWDKITRFGLNKCPKCRSEFESIERIDTIQANRCDQNLSELQNELKMSSKIKNLIEIIKQKISQSEKIVVVSQWVTMLDIVRTIVDEKIPGIQSVSLQGNISMRVREESIDKFQNDDNIKICYISLMSSAEGINLTAANNLVLLDTWWNQSKMIQVSDRVHRIGQVRDVNIYKLSVGGENSIEERVQRLVSKKERLKNLVMNKWNIEKEESYDDDWIKQPVKLIG